MLFFCLSKIDLSVIESEGWTKLSSSYLNAFFVCVTRFKNKTNTYSAIVLCLSNPFKKPFKRAEYSNYATCIVLVQCGLYKFTGS